jgi:hypothetical protein
MDRREALKKMMAGGAVVAGASMVSSSHVFAASSSTTGEPIGSGITTPPPTGQTVNDRRSARWTITAPNASCSLGDLQIASYAVGRGVVGDLSVMIEAPSGFGSNGYVIGGTTATFTVVSTKNPGSNAPFKKGDEFEVTWYVKYSCTVKGQQAGCQLVDYTYRYVNQGGGNNPSWQPRPGYPIASSPRPCGF